MRPKLKGIRNICIGTFQLTLAEMTSNQTLRWMLWITAIICLVTAIAWFTKQEPKP